MDLLRSFPVVFKGLLNSLESALTLSVLPLGFPRGISIFKGGDSLSPPGPLE